MFLCSHCPPDLEMLPFLKKQTEDAQVNFTNLHTDFSFHRFSLEQTNLPPVDQILNGVLAIEKAVKLQGWKTAQSESRGYRGFSITYNPDFIDSEQSIYHQTWGNKTMTQYLTRHDDGLGDVQLKNSYYDSYGFRKIPPLVREHLGSTIDCFATTVVRSRVAYSYTPYKVNPAAGWHKDEFPADVLRVVIPIQTSDHHVLNINGYDEFGNTLTINDYHLEIGYGYSWNTRIPHQATVNKTMFQTTNRTPRIHLIFGLSPYYDYHEDGDYFTKSELWGVPIVDIINQGLVFKHNR